MAIQRKPIYLSEFKKKAVHVPCRDKLTALVKAELMEGNVLLSVDKLTSFSSETYYICQFKHFSKTKPEGLETGKYADYYQESLSYSDNSGTVEVRFNCDWEVIKEKLI